MEGSGQKERGRDWTLGPELCPEMAYVFSALKREQVHGACGALMQRAMSPEMTRQLAIGQVVLEGTRTSAC